MELFEQIKTLITEAEEDVSKFYEKGNKASAVRIRKAMQEVKKLAQDLRVHVQDTKNNM
jgi:rubrerythrin